MTGPIESLCSAMQDASEAWEEYVASEGLWRRQPQPEVAAIWAALNSGRAALDRIEEVESGA